MRQLPVSPRPRDEGAEGRWRLVALTAGIVIVAVAGYAGYVAYPRFGLPAGTGAGLLLLAAGAGVASFFSPCSFPLLLTLLSRRVAGAPGARRGRTAVAFAATFSLGAVAFLTLVGAVVGAGGGAVIGSVTFTSAAGIAIRITVGVALVLLGLIQAEVIPVSFHGVEERLGALSRGVARVRRTHPTAGTAAFGFAYLLIGFG